MFLDTEEGIPDAVQRGATHFWANTVLYAEHPSQISAKRTPHGRGVKVVGQPSLCIDRFDDNAFLNDVSGRSGGLRLPKAWAGHSSHPSVYDKKQNLNGTLATVNESDYPIVAKHIHGWGSHGVQICHDAVELKDHVVHLLLELPEDLLEEYLRGGKGTTIIVPLSQQPVPVLKPPERYDGCWALPPLLDSPMSTVSHHIVAEIP